MAFQTPMTNLIENDCGCDCGCDDCECCGKNTCDPAPTQIPATAPGKVVVRTGEDLRVSRGVNQIDAINAAKILITLPQAGIVGDEVLVNACDADVDVEGGALDIMNQDPITGVFTIHSQGSALFTLTSCCDPNDPNKKREWATLVGEYKCPDCVPDLATLAAIKTKHLDSCCRVLVQTLDQEFEFDPTSTVAADGITILAGSEGGRWLRIEGFSKKWSLQTNWFVNPAAGSDENDGATEATALKNVAEACRRLHQARYGIEYMVNLLGDAPYTDRFRPSMVFEQNQENIDPVTGFESNALITLIGRRTYGTTGTMTASALSTGNIEFNFTDAAFPGAVGDLIEILNDPATPANNGATGFVGRVTGAVVTTSEFETAAGNRVTVAFPAGTTYRIVTLPKWNAPITEGPAQGYCRLKNLDLVGPDALPPAARKSFTLRGNSWRIEVCQIRRCCVLTNATRFSSCGFLYPAASLYAVGQGQGIANKTVVTSSTSLVLTNSLMINADLRLLSTSENVFASLYVETSVVSSVNFNGFPNYINNNVPSNVFNGAAYLQITGTGFRSYDWPTVAPAAALLITDDSTVNVAAGVIGGTNAAAGSVGVLVRGGSKLLIRDALTPTDATWINGVLANVTIRNPTNPAVLVAVASQPHPLVAGAVSSVASALTTWANWTAAPFNRFASNPDDGSYIASVP